VVFEAVTQQGLEGAVADMTDQVTRKNLAELKAAVDSLHVGDPHWADDIQNYKDIITRVEEVVREMRLAAENEGRLINTRYVLDWALQLEGTA
jgi:hypothetical protein